MIRLRFSGRVLCELPERRLGRFTLHSVPRHIRGDYFFGVIDIPSQDSVHDLDGYAALLVRRGLEVPAVPIGTAVVANCEDLESISEGSVLALNQDGSIRSLYRPESPNNVIFATGRCNSNCLMCSQPPVPHEDADLVREHLRLIDLIQEPPRSLGITGGEPTLLGDGLVRVLEHLKRRFPSTHVHMLTNGRLYAYEDLVAKIGAVQHPSFVSAIPLYSDVAAEHDYIVQARGAFDQTLVGLYNAARHGVAVEIRVVLHRLTIPRMRELAEFIYRNLPFVSHVALMGLENMGYTRRNWDLLWIDPLDYVDVLETAVKHLYYRRVPVSIYNLQLCVLPKSVWPFARKSISDFKNVYLDCCDDCDVREQCGGLFASTESRHSRGIGAIRAEGSATGW